MQLLSATLRNYRIHREKTVQFDPSLTLISGPNESGKSTLIEAIHRGLFLRSKTGGEIQKAMISFLPGASGHPEVEVSFSAAGKTFQLIKRFSGPSGTTRLTETGGQVLHGDEAESRVASLLRTEDLGRATSGKLAQQWAHLWVWQGNSGDDPCSHAGVEHDTLLQRLRQTGGAAVMQSECDSRVAARFSDELKAIFSQRDKAKKGSALEKAESAVSDAEATYTRAAGRVERLGRAVSDFEQAVATIERAKKDLQALEKEHDEVAEKLLRVEKLTTQEKLRKAEADSATDHYKTLLKADEQIREFRGKIAVTEKDLDPKKEELAKLERQRADFRAQAEKAEEAYQKAGEATRSSRLKRDLTVAIGQLFERKARLDELSKKSETIRKRENQVSELREQLARLPGIDERGLKKLHTLEGDFEKAETALNAMAAGVEVIFASGVVRVGETPLSAGQSRTVTETTEVAFGDDLRLRIHPGGGDSLAEARRQVVKCREELQKALDEIGLESLAAASDACGRRGELQKQIEREETILQGMEAGKIPDLLSQAQQEYAAAQAEVDRRKEQAPGVPLPGDLDAARTALAEMETGLRAADETEKESRATRDAMRKTLLEIEETRKQAAKAIEKEQTQLNDFSAQCRLLLQNHGDDETRAHALRTALSTKDQKEAALQETRKTLAELDPERLERDHKRFERARRACEEQQQQARETRAETQAILRSDGNENPEADLAFARARLESARLHLTGVRRKADAIRLLDELFTEEQRALADSFTQPLAEKVSGYLQCLFGADVRASLTLGEGAFTALQLMRGGSGAGAMPFENLSGGAREQVAAAVRLAMAEILAEEHDGCLPIVFDDGFAYSDPGRVKRLQVMLDLAASRGLQLIVLTCNPSDYTTLGANPIQLAIPSLTLDDPVQV